MANKGYTYVLKAPLLLVTLLLLFTLKPTEAHVGLTYDGPGNNLPSPQQVVNIYKANGITYMRMYCPNQETLQALQNSGINLLLDVPKENIQSFAQNPSSAVQWVQQNVVPYASSIYQLAVGNEVPQELRPFVGPAMANTLNALNKVGLGRIEVTTSIGMSELIDTYPPSNGRFRDLGFMSPIVNFLKQNGFPLIVNVYPYITYIQNQDTVPLDYALFTYPGIKFTDPNGLQYQNLFDALVDSVYAALGKLNARNPGMQNGGVGLHISESGWPSAGGPGASRDNAAPAASRDNAGQYLRALSNHAQNGTPRSPYKIRVFLFSMFDNNQKPGDESERHYGIFETSGQIKYPGITFN